jgi:transposase
LRAVGEGTALPQDIETLQTMLAERDSEIAQLREYIRLLKHQRFGSSSERAHRDQLGLFNEAEALVAGGGEEEPGVPVAAHTRTPRGRRPLPAWMPREEILHDVPEAEKVCPQDGTPLVEIARERSEQLEFVPATARVLVHVRPKYGCPRCKTGVHVAPLPPQPIPKSLASPSLLAYVAVSKYADALPLYRQEQMLARLGIDLSRATLASWMVRVGELVQPLVNRMREEILESGFVQCDESRFQVLREPGKPAESLSYIWVQRGGPAGNPLLLYEYDPSRSAEVPKRLFEGFQGVLQTDGYEGYGAIGREPGIVHVGCWAHARRKFVEALKGQSPKPAAKRKARHSQAEAGLHWIQKLYAIERRVKDATVEERLRVRQAESLSVVAALRDWLDRALPTVVPQSLTGKAVAYLQAQWSKLVRVFDYGFVPLDTNLVENAVRPFALGRKNWLFADTVGGAEASANLYSVVETAKANRLEPWAYLQHVFAELPKARSFDDVDALLPDRVQLRNDAVR